MRCWIPAVAAATSAFMGPVVCAQSTAFTYQGHLKDNGQPAAGLHDFRFKLFDALSGGTQIGATQCVDNVQLTDGLFTTTIDFGSQFSTPAQRFLEIEVRRDTGLDCSNATGFTTLTTRQLIAAAPLATHARSAFTLDAANGSVANAVFVDDTGKVGIGTLAPTHSVHIAKPEPTIALQDTDSSGEPGGRQVGYISYRDSANVERGWIGYGSEGDPDLSIINARSTGDIVLNTLGFSSRLLVACQAQFQDQVGMGTSTPQSQLHVIAQDRAAVIGEAFNATGMGGRGGAIGISGSTFNTSNAVGISGTGGIVSGTNNIGVRGTVTSTDASSFGVFSNGRFAATGTKSFRIDHPENPDNWYLFHYCAESPEVINFYRGSTTLDANGRAIVTLPRYFARINTRPSYQLTAIGAPMPMLHVSTKIDDQSLVNGAVAGPGQGVSNCWFEIAGGVPGGEVCWRVEAVRNDEFVRLHGAPVEVEKPEAEKGKLDVDHPASRR